MSIAKIIVELDRKDDKKMIECAICRQIFQNNQGLSAHVKPKHNVSWKEYKKKYPNDGSISIEQPIVDSSKGDPKEKESVKSNIIKKVEKIDPPKEELQKYATLEDLNELKDYFSKNIQYLAAVISGDDPSNPGEPEAEVNIERIQQDEIYVPDASLTKVSLWLKPQTLLYFDMAKIGAFVYYPGFPQEESPFAVFIEGHKEFEGLITLSDFFNTIVRDYCIRVHNKIMKFGDWIDL